MPETTTAPGLAADGISGDIFGTPSGAAWDAARLIFGDWLELVFSDVGTGSATIMTHVAGYVNFLAYILIVVIMSYVLIASVIKTASEGKVMGNGWSTVWLPLRTFLACFLIFPVGIGQASTISFIQVAVAWLGMVGSNAADRVATFVVQNLTRSSVAISVEVQGYKTISDMTTIAFCASGFNYGLKDNYDRPSEFYGSVATPSSGGVEGGSHGQYHKDVPIETNLATYSNVNVGHKGYCGTLKKPDIFVGGEDGSRAIPNADASRGAFEIILATQKEVYEEVVKPVQDYGFNDYMSVLESSSNSSTRGDLEGNVLQSVTAFFDIINRYEQRMGEHIIDSMNSDNTYIQYEMVDGHILAHINESEYSRMGWAYLGAYYTLMSKAIGEVTEVAKSVVDVTDVKEPNGCRLARPDGWANAISHWWNNRGEDECDYEREFYKKDIILDFASNAMSDRNDSSGSINMMSSACNSARSCSTEAMEASFASSIGRPFFQYEEYYGAVSEGGTNTAARTIIETLGWGRNSGIMGLDVNSDNDTFFSSDIAPGALFISDPITFTSNLGHTIVYSVTVARIILGVAEGFATGLIHNSTPFVGGFAAGFGGIIQAVVDFLKTIITLIYPQAAAMAYFLPLLPSLIWAMAFLSWLLMYAEAIFNAPLAVTLMATPEGEGIAGSRMERKIALLAALILKPTFLVVGLLLSMMILSIGFVFLNQIFWLAAANVTWRFDPVAVLALISIWFGIITVFMHNTFKIIPTFADNSLEWFLGGIARTFGNDLDNVTADQFQNSFDGSSEMSTGTGKSIGIFGRGIKNSVDKKKSDKSSEKENN